MEQAHMRQNTSESAAPADVGRFIYSVKSKNVYKNKLFKAYERFCRASVVQNVFSVRSVILAVYFSGERTDEKSLRVRYWDGNCTLYFFLDGWGFFDS
jgi:hypothetical protein